MTGHSITPGHPRSWRARLSLRDGLFVSAGLSSFASLIFFIESLAQGRSAMLASVVSIGQAITLFLACLCAWVLQQLCQQVRPFMVKPVLHAAAAIFSGAVWGLGVGAFIWIFEPVQLHTPLIDIIIGTAMSGLFVYALIAGIGVTLSFRRRMYERDAAATRAELAALRARIEPHFLYNALESITALIHKDPDAAEEAVARLGSALRRLLARDEDGRDTDPRLARSTDGLVALADELGYVRDTLFIEQLRMGDRLTVIERIAPETLDYAVPALTLQPLVENAVQHGLSPRPSGGTLSIVSRLEKDRLVLEVSDDGVGASEEHLRNAPGLGLDHLERRLASHFGERSSFDIVATAGQGVSIRLVIPAEEL